jgi:hypothetical protein
MSWRSITGVVMVLLLTAVFSCAAVCATNAGHACCAPQMELCGHHSGHHLHGTCDSAPSMAYLCSHRNEAARIAASQQRSAMNFQQLPVRVMLFDGFASAGPQRDALFRSRPSLNSLQIPLRI